MGLFEKILHSFQLLYLLFRKEPSKMFDMVLNALVNYAHIVYARISLWQWYGLNVFRRLEWIPEMGKVGSTVDSASIFIIFKNARDLFFWHSCNFQSEGAKRQKSLILHFCFFINNCQINNWGDFPQKIKQMLNNFLGRFELRS